MDKLVDGFLPCRQEIVHVDMTLFFLFFQRLSFKLILDLKNIRNISWFPWKHLVSPQSQ